MVTIGALLADPKYPEKLILQKLFCAYTSCEREDLRSKMDEEMTDDLTKKMFDAYTMYARDKKPLEYLLGYVEFF
jgi:methylase of polypeptide subunit release factors